MTRAPNISVREPKGWYWLGVAVAAVVDAGLLEYVKRPARTTKHGTRAALRLTKSARFDLVLD